jgi:nicotinic acid phosphoribosyltransferase
MSLQWPTAISVPLGDTHHLFRLFFRTVPDNGGFDIAAGLEQVIDYVENLSFSGEDIAYLRGRGMFSENFWTI